MALMKFVRNAGGSRISPRRITKYPPTKAKASATYCSASMEGTVAPNTVETKPTRRSRPTPTMAPSIDIVRLWRVVRGAPR